MGVHKISSKKVYNEKNLNLFCHTFHFVSLALNVLVSILPQNISPKWLTPLFFQLQAWHHASLFLPNMHIQPLDIQNHLKSGQGGISNGPVLKWMGFRYGYSYSPKQLELNIVKVARFKILSLPWFYLEQDNLYAYFKCCLLILGENILYFLVFITGCNSVGKLGNSDIYRVTR